MGGSGSGGPFANRKPEDLAKQVRKAEEATSDAAFDAKLSTTLADMLGSYNGRDVRLVEQRLVDVKNALEDSVESALDQFFGGSVAKRTYVDGLSDIDSILIIDDTDLADPSPGRTLDRITKILQLKFGGIAEISHGRMAVTVEYPDGMKIQLLPAISEEGGRLRVPSSRRDGWSEIDPRGFREALTRRNQKCGGKLIPTIKLAKAIIGTLPEPQRLSGYHMESLGIAAFRNYRGPKTTAAMLPAFFEQAKSLVLSPIKDSTGQSVHVDEYLGPVNSDARVAASHILGRLEKRMRNATAAGSTAQWQALFGYDE